MWSRRNGVSRVAMLMGLVAAPLSVHAASFAVPAGTTDTATKTVAGTDTGTVESGAVLRSTSGTATIG